MRKKRAIDVLFPATRRGVLELTYGEPDRWWFLSEMAGRLGTSPSSLQRELEALASTGLLRVRREGRRTYYQAEANASIYPELRGIVEKTMGVAERIHAALEPLGAKIRLALVYGSVARGEDRATSDVDVLIVGDDLALEDVYRRLGTVERKLGRKVNPTLYTREEFRRRYESRNPFLVKLLARKRIVLLGSEDAALEAAR